jgi:hypothetical protein
VCDPPDAPPPASEEPPPDEPPPEVPPVEDPPPDEPPPEEPPEPALASTDAEFDETATLVAAALELTGDPEEGVCVARAVAGAVRWRWTAWWVRCPRSAW